MLRTLAILTVTLLLLACAAEPEMSSTTAEVPEHGLRTSQIDDSGTSHTYYQKGDGALLRNVASYSTLEDLELTCVGNACTPADDTVNPEAACFVGDRNQVCSLLAEMSTHDREEYADGDHELVSLTSCFLKGRGTQPVVTRLRAIHDFADRAITATLEISACAD